MKALGTGGPAVGARHGIELPDPDAAPLVIRTWMPHPDAPEQHFPVCRSRCCGTWHLSLPQTLPTPPQAPLAGRGGQAIPSTGTADTVVPRPRRPRPASNSTPSSTSTSRSSTRATGTVPETSSPVLAAAQASLAAARAGRPVACVAGCGAQVAAEYVLRTGQDWHACCQPLLARDGAR